MGGGGYDFHSRSLRSSVKGYSTVTKDNLASVYKQKSVGRIHESLDPNGVVIREARDSEEHPNSLAIIVGLDVTGSMGSVPAQLIKEGLPNMIQNIFNHGIADPQVAFLAIGDHEYDRHPLQIGQFESSDEKLDSSLECVYPEGGGGGNSGESYLLAWYHAAKHTEVDCFEKRGQKGILVTIGDEPGLDNVPGSVLANLYGLQKEDSYTAEELLIAASEKYHVIHINVNETYSGHSDRTKRYWENLLKENFICVDSHTEIPEVIGNKVAELYNGERVTINTNINSSDVTQPTTPDDSGTSIML